ncbi:MAG: hypothetical protein ACI7YS_08880 [Flavobacterium sp.]
MKIYFLLIFTIILNINCSAQNLFLNVFGNSEKETKTIDSIGYTKNHPNVKSIADENNLLSTKLTQLGYIENEILELKKITDSTFQTQFSIGKKTDSLSIHIGRNSELKSLGLSDSKNDTIKIAFSESETFMNNTLNALEKKGYSLAKLQLSNFKKEKNNLYAELNTNLGNQRQLNDIVIVGFDNFPESHRINIKKLYRKKTFNQENLRKVNNNFNQFQFASQTKYPEILFTKDTTKVYVYLQKAKPNKFDGLIGFSNDENSKFIFNGYLDLLLVNTMNAGEAFSLFWKSDGQEQTTFNVNLEIPYIFKSRLGLKTNLNIFKQDSTFQNTKKAIDLGYLFNYNTRLYLGYQSTESSDIQNQNNSFVNDYNNNFKTLLFEYSNRFTDNYLFPEKTKIYIKTGFGTRQTNSTTNDQTFTEINLKHDIYINKKNSFNLRSQNSFLFSDTYIINELYRFGGINSIRGFNENSLQGNTFASILTEYRNQLAPNLYVHTIFDYGYYQDRTSNIENSLLGIGLGVGLASKNGLLNISYANGSQKNQSINPSNSIVHVRFSSTF